MSKSDVNFTIGADGSAFAGDFVDDITIIKNSNNNQFRHGFRTCCEGG